MLQNKLLEAWNSEYPLVLQHHLTSFQHYLESLVNLHRTVVKDDDQFCAWYFEFERDLERQLGIIVLKNYQKRGIGRALLAKEKLTDRQLSA